MKEYDYAHQSNRPRPLVHGESCLSDKTLTMVKARGRQHKMLPTFQHNYGKINEQAPAEQDAPQRDPA